MSKRSNGKQESTQKQFSSIAEEWSEVRPEDSFIFFSISPSYAVHWQMRGSKTWLIKLIREHALPQIMKDLGVWGTKPISDSVRKAWGFPRRSLWQRIRDWFFSFKIKEGKRKRKKEELYTEADILKGGGRMTGEDVAYLMIDLAKPFVGRCVHAEDGVYSAVVFVQDRYGVHASSIGNERDCLDLFNAVREGTVAGNSLYQFAEEKKNMAANGARYRERLKTLRVPLWTRMKRLFDPFAE